MEENNSNGRGDPDDTAEKNEDVQNQENVSEVIHKLITDLAEELMIECVEKGKDQNMDDEHREFIEQESESIAEEYKRRIWERFFSLASETGYERDSILEIRILAYEEFDKMVKDFEEKLRRKLAFGSADSIGMSLKGDACLGRRTLAIIKPDAYKHADEIIYAMKKHGFVVVQERRVRLSPEQACLFYGEHLQKVFSSRLIGHLSSGPIVALCIASAHCPNTVAAWREIMGPSDVAEAAALFPNSLRAKYGNTGDQVKNALHGSHSIEDAAREIHFFFPEIILDPLTKIIDIGSILDKENQKILKKGLVMLCKEKPENPINWFAYWLLHNNPNQASCSLDAKPTIHFDDEFGTGKKCFMKLN
ncbi:hypothetical protein J437_LFUL017852 [Ladona fulva]|uniref:Nucleoside diphosphate kinase-like domain-containing protein n=1 Tax=Ladona fulva TaxID=123851 RepID=A0A8K0KD04_LADFU|nr:hypothetical protein J437_LFUL017852 [Ladona fulva]